MDKTIHVFQFNAQKSRIAFTCLTSFLNDKKIRSFIVLIQEPYVHKGKVCGLPSSTSVLSIEGTKEEPTRAAIWASGDLHIWLNSDLSNKDLATAIWKTPQGDYFQLRSGNRRARCCDNNWLVRLSFDKGTGSGRRRL